MSSVVLVGLFIAYCFFGLYLYFNFLPMSLTALFGLFITFCFAGLYLGLAE